MTSNNDDHSNMHGYSMPLNPKIHMDDIEEEVTRKIAPTMIMPSLGPLPTMPMGMSSLPSPTIHTFASKPSMLYQPQGKHTVPFSWKLHTVPVLPEFHVLERSAAFVPRSEPSEVASRISDILRERSIEAQYETGKAKVKCTTTEGVDFRIRLYRGRGRYNHGIIVEVQRRFGMSLGFHSDSQAILDGARGKTSVPPAFVCSRFPEVSDESDEDSEVSAEESATSSLAMVANMMKLPGFDSQYLGLQTLSPLVDSERLNISTARAVATSLFQRDSEVGKKVLDYIIKNKNNKTIASSRKRGVFDDEEDEDEQESSMTLRNMCLNILANATRANEKIPEYLRETLRPILLQDLYAAEKHPNTALSAANCLKYFIAGDHDTTELAEAFQVALGVGEARHANLMHQARKCLDATDAR